MEGLVSIVIPAYNSGPFIEETIRSALNQTWENKEIIVVNDGSTDTTLDIARKLPVTVINQSNKGASAARNHGVSVSKGDFIQYLDADDILAPDKIECQLREYKDPRTLLSGSWGSFLYRIRTAKFDASLLWQNLSPEEWLVRKMTHNLHMQTATWLVSRELIEATGPWRESLSLDDDGEYFCRVLAQSNGVHFVPESKVYYRATGDSLSKVTARKLNSQWESMRTHIDCVDRLADKAAAERAVVSYLQTWLPYFHPDRPDLVKACFDIADEFDGQLILPSLSRKYAWIGRLFGYPVGKFVSTVLPEFKWNCYRQLDLLAYHFEQAINAGRSLSTQK